MSNPADLAMNPSPAPSGGSAEERLAALGIALPKPAAPVAAYVPFVRTGNFLHISGQISLREGNLMSGRLGADYDLALGQQAARACGLMILAQIKAAIGSLDRVEHIVKLNVFVSSDPHFFDQPKVADGASTLMVDVFGEAGRHARAAVGVAALPLGAAVEVDAIVAIRPD